MSDICRQINTVSLCLHLLVFIVKKDFMYISYVTMKNKNMKANTYWKMLKNNSLIFKMQICVIWYGIVEIIFMMG